jgi:carnitine monooxygenase subunit
MPEDGGRSIHSAARPYRADAERSYVLPPNYYTDPAIWEREKQAIFYKAWNFAGHVSQLRGVGDYITCPVADQEIFVIRGKDDRIRAFYNVCAHRAHQLVKGCGSAKVITCPYHAWSYHADGRLRTARGTEHVADFNPADFHLKEVRVETLAGFIYVNLDPDAASLKSQTGDLEAEMLRYQPELPQLKFCHRLTYNLKANWKNVVDNFLECYHCPPAHPAFVEMITIKQYRTKTYGIYSSHISPPGRADNSAFHYTEAEGKPNNFSAWWLYPSVTFAAFPGDPNITVLHIMPTGPETVAEHFDFFFMSETLSDYERDAIKYVDSVLQPEDIGLVESVQRGLHSKGYQGGRYVVDAGRTDISEHGLHHFHGLVLTALGESPA